MADPAATKELYIKAAQDHKMNCIKEVLYIMDKASGESHQGVMCNFSLDLHGNKRNQANEMYRKRMTDDDVLVLCQSLKGNTWIVTLNLGYNRIGDKGAEVIGNFMLDADVLRTLILSYNDMGAVGGQHIARGIQMNESIRVLKLDGNKIGNQGGMAIAGALQVNSILEDLNLDDTDLTTQTIVAFTTVLKANSAVKRIHLGRPLLHSQQEETIVHVARMLQLNRHLEEIHLSKHGVMNFGVSRLTECLVDNIALVHLDLSCNRISRDGIRAIADHLARNPAIRVLNLAHNRAEDDGVVYLSDALSRRNFTLQTLVLCSNSLTDEGLCAVARCLLSNPTLTQVYIWGNTVGPKGAKAFYELTTGRSPRLAAQDTDVRAYVVDDVPYLARVDSPY